MEDLLNRLKKYLGEIEDIQHAMAVLEWDQATYMPQSGGDERGFQLSTLARLAHDLQTSDEMGQVIQDLELVTGQMPPDSDDACLVRMARRKYDKATCVPTDWVGEFNRICALSYSEWEKARKNSDFKAFQPTLEKIISMMRQYADFFAPYDHIYDPLLDDYERDLKTVDVQTIFGRLRPVQVSLIQEIAQKKPIDASFLSLEYPEQKQWDFGVSVISEFGYDWQRGRQDRSAHPFTTTFGQGDVRITTRLDKAFLPTALFGTMHECGHALYDQGIHPSLARTPLFNGASLAVHESQSRLWENLIGRSKAFWIRFYPRLQECFHSQLLDISFDSFYRGINKVVPSFIRVEADEATYNLHIMLRMELEIALIEGSLEVKDLPSAWNERMRDYLGIVPPDDANGVLQDVHWASGLIGYFPTYTLGNLVSVQIWEQVKKDLPDLDKKIEQGCFSDLLNWLRVHIHRHGAKFTPKELVKKVTGSSIDPQPYMNYLRNKYGEIYHL